MTKLKFFRPSLSIVIALISVFIFSLTFLAYQRGETLRSSISNNRNNLNAVNQSLTKLASPANFELGSRNSLLETTISEAESIQNSLESQEKLPSRALLQINLGLITSNARSVRSAYSSQSNANSATLELLQHHSGVLTALQPLLEYNALSDMAGEMTDEERAQRVTAANEGLRAIQGELAEIDANTQNLKYIRDDLSIIIESVEGLIGFSSGTFPGEGDWVEQFKQSQNQIINDRQIFWKREREKTTTLLSEANRLLARLESQINTKSDL
jgi:hypothetical protein